MKISDIKSNPNNPRVIKDDKFKKLVASVKDFPKMMELRPIIIDDTNTILGGNMRYKALQEVGYDEIPSEWIKRAKDLTEDEKNQFYGSKYEKIYHIQTENYVSDELLSRLRAGVKIITKGRRIGSEKSNRKTLPCQIERIYENLFTEQQLKPKKKLMIYILFYVKEEIDKLEKWLDLLDSLS